MIRRYSTDNSIRGEIFSTINFPQVLEVNKGGAVCDVFGLKAFLPGSHFTGVPDESIVGQTIRVSRPTFPALGDIVMITSLFQVKFLDVVEDEGKVVVSQRRAVATLELARGIIIWRQDAQ